MNDSKIKTFTNLKELGSFLKENREFQNLEIEDVSKLLLIKKDILDKFEKGEVNIEHASYLKGFFHNSGVCRKYSCYIGINITPFSIQACCQCYCSRV